MKLFFLSLVSMSLLACQTHGPIIDKESERKRLTKNWETRGGTSQGLSGSPDLRTDPNFVKIQNAKSLKEKDRLAILSQTGEYEVSFEFVETFHFADKKDLKPYHSWATEYIFPIKDEPDFISLQHILVMRTFGDDKKEREPVIVKHWRQDWKYQDPVLWDYVGNQTWQKRQVSQKQVSGAWSQTVYQVDDSPRYKTYGRWEHQKDFSRWTSYRTQRPLPRREATVRSDYDILDGVNIVTITPKGWYHEQINEKLQGSGSDPKVLVAKEIGLNSYHRIQGFDFQPAKDYWLKTSAYWDKVREKWTILLETRKTIHLKKEVDGKKLHETHFAFADGLSKSDDPKKLESHVNKTIEAYLVR